jgi:tRNA threonylcarbamoyladenosine dehydratase
MKSRKLILIVVNAVIVPPTVIAFCSSPTIKTSGKTRFRSQNIAPTDDYLTDMMSQEDDEARSQRNLRFGGVGRLYANEVPQPDTDPSQLDPYLQVIERLHHSTVAIVGLGGVGSWAAEALCRSGVGNLILIDLDDICISNTNRQLHATSTSIGQMKIDEMRRRLIHINPHCSVTNIHDFVTETNVHDILDSMLPDVDVILDAIDSRKAKAALIAACVEKKIPIVTCGGAAGKKDPSQILLNDLARANGDDLLTAVRRNLRKSYGFSEGKKFQELKGKLPKKWKIPAVYSTEETKELPDGDEKVGALRRCDGALGTACFVTGTFGFVAAGQVVDMIALGKLVRPRKS